MEVTRVQIRALRDEAVAAGDYDTVYICRLALSGAGGVHAARAVRAAQQMCAAIINSATAQEDGNEHQ